ncbi:hypothetical protein DFP72DRAFT_577135 [Ephemerocybe angulata]|uniref:Uncharacterized protein n=1 Tax=Ephemerocybe angulata TaxID=980116 RepID=A0A8H6HJQ8_9AGAR|nr:hypothetical protein DFP72DRAFT_577135 [Tulosesus angulatus]
MNEWNVPRDRCCCTIYLCVWWFARSIPSPLLSSPLILYTDWALCFTFFLTYLLTYLWVRTFTYRSRSRFSFLHRFLDDLCLYSSSSSSFSFYLLVFLIFPPPPSSSSRPTATPIAPSILPSPPLSSPIPPQLSPALRLTSTRSSLRIPRSQSTYLDPRPRPHQSTFGRRRL